MVYVFWVKQVENICIVGGGVEGLCICILGVSISISIWGVRILFNLRRDGLN